MIGKSKSGAGFGGLTRYLMTGRKDHRNPDRVAWTSIRELALDAPKDAAWTMRLTASLGNTDKPVQHISISLAPGEHLTREQWEQVIDTTLRDLGLEGHQALIVAHRDTAQEHIHLVVNRVHPETLRAWDRWQDRKRLMASLRPQELALDLRPTPHVKNPDLIPDTLVQRFERTGELPLLDYARAAARPIFQVAGSWGELHERLSEQGLYLERKGQGLVLSDDSSHVKASSVDQSASLRALEARLGPYQESRLLQEVDSDLRGDRRAELYVQVDPALRAGREADSALKSAREAAHRVEGARYSLRSAIADAFRDPAQVESRYFAHLDREKAPPSLRPAQLGELRGLILHAGGTSIPLGDQGKRALQKITGQLPGLAADYLRAQEDLARTETRYADARKEEALLREHFRPQFAELEQIQARSTALYQRMLSLRPRDQIAMVRRHGLDELERAVRYYPEEALRTVTLRGQWMKALSPDLNRVLDRRLSRNGLSRPASGESFTGWTASALHRDLHPLHTVQVLTRGGVAFADAAGAVARAYATVRHPGNTARRYAFRAIQKATGFPVAEAANAASLAVSAVRSPARTTLLLTARSLGLPTLPVRLAVMAWDLIREQVLSR